MSISLIAYNTPISIFIRLDLLNEPRHFCERTSSSQHGVVVNKHMFGGYGIDITISQ